LIACAAALHHAQVAVRHFGYQPVIAILPESADADLVATLRIGPPVGRPPAGLFAAVTTRHCNRGPYRKQPLSMAQLERLRAAAVAEGCWLAVITDRSTKAAAADLIAAGDRIKWRDPEFRNELAERLIPNRGRRRDGMPGYAFGIPGPAARLAPTVVRRLDLGSLRAHTDRAAANASPALLVIGTDRDDPPAWIAAGQAMSHVLLSATAEGLATAFLSQAIEVPELRPRLAALLEHRGQPQILLRVGHPRRRPRLAPRRPIDEVLTSTGPAGDGNAATTPRRPS
ncbi:MAG TPA: nitroreductase family protein, partial [Micromonosporaceae bacterium]|nr:nitroreductase family protein [Micromonosporaceae bacterium]